MELRDGLLRELGQRHRIEPVGRDGAFESGVADDGDPSASHLLVREERKDLYRVLDLVERVRYHHTGVEEYPVEYLVVAGHRCRMRGDRGRALGRASRLVHDDLLPRRRDLLHDFEEARPVEGLEALEIYDEEIDVGVVLHVYQIIRGGQVHLVSVRDHVLRVDEFGDVAHQRHQIGSALAYECASLAVRPDEGELVLGQEEGIVTARSRYDTEAVGTVHHDAAPVLHPALSDRLVESPVELLSVLRLPESSRYDRDGRGLLAVDDMLEQHCRPLVRRDREDRHIGPSRDIVYRTVGPAAVYLLRFRMEQIDVFPADPASLYDVSQDDPSRVDLVRRRPYDEDGLRLEEPSDITLRRMHRLRFEGRDLQQRVERHYTPVARDLERIDLELLDRDGRGG